MVRGLVLLILGALIGAALFHVYYLRLPAEARCGWDHPLDRDARDRCRTDDAADGMQGYGRKARRDLDRLIGNLAD